MSTWRSWELVLPKLERRHDVLAPTLPGHAGGPRISGEIDDTLLVDAVERAMDDAGFETAHLVGNSLGGYLALRLAARGRARSVVALAPAGGWAAGDDARRELLRRQRALHEQLKAAAPQLDAMTRTAEGQRRVTELLTERFDHIPRDLLTHIVGAAAFCTAATPLVDHALGSEWPLEARRVTCPVRVIWGAQDRLLPWPSAAARFRDSLAGADWIVLDGVGHCPQLDVPLVTAELVLELTAV
jgi:pimeloyl-ACP methyl ester carboxylesterase